MRVVFCFSLLLSACHPLRLAAPSGRAVSARCMLCMAAKTKAAAAPAAEASAEAMAAAAALLEEVAKEERSLSTIASLVSTLEAEPMVDKATKLKRALQADWKIEYASDSAAIQPFVTGPENPFAVTEGIVHRFKKTGEFETIEVRRKLGPFGNSKATLNGKYSFEKGALRWRASYALDARSRELPPPKGAGVAEMRVTHVSPSLLLLRPTADESSLLIFARVEKLKEWLDELRVPDEEE